MKITITEDQVYIEGFDLPLDREKMIDWSCRLASHEAVGWAMKRLGEELEKSVSFYRTGDPIDNIGMD